MHSKKVISRKKEMKSKKKIVYLKRLKRPDPVKLICIPLVFPVYSNFLFLKDSRTLFRVDLLLAVALSVRTHMSPGIILYCMHECFLCSEKFYTGTKKKRFMDIVNIYTEKITFY